MSDSSYLGVLAINGNVVLSFRECHVSVMEVDEKENEIFSYIEGECYLELSSCIKAAESLVYFVENFHNFKKAEVQSFVFQMIRFWYHDKFTEISQELNEHLFVFLFDYCGQNYLSFADPVKDQLAGAQVLFSLCNYPGVKADFWNVIFNTNSSMLHNFLIHFGGETFKYSPERLELFATIKAALREQEVLPAIITYIFQLMESDPVTALKILANFTHWCDMDFVGDEKSMNSLRTELTKPQCTALVLNVYENIIQRNSTSDALPALVEALASTEILIEILQQISDPAISKAVCSLVKTIGIITQDSTYYDFSISLLDSGIDAAIQVSTFLCYTLSQQDKETFDFLSTFEIAYNHLVSFFNEEIVTPSFFKQNLQYPIAFSNICIACWRPNAKACNEYVLSSLEGLNPLETPAIAASLAFLIVQMHNFSEMKGSLTNYISTILDISKIEPPFSQQELTAFYVFHLMAEKTPDQFKSRKDIIQCMLNAFVSIIEIEGMDPNDLSIFLEAFATFATLLSSNIEIPVELSQQFIDSWKPEYVKIGISLIAYQQNSKDQRFQELFPIFVQAVSEHAQSEDVLNYVHCTLEFFQFKMNVLPDSQEAKNVLDLLHPYCIGNDLLMSLFIKASAALLSDPFEYLSSFIGEFNSPKALASLSYHFQLKYRMETNQEQISEILNHFTSSIFCSYMECNDVTKLLGIYPKELRDTLHNVAQLAKEQFSIFSDDLKSAIFVFVRSVYLKELTNIELFADSVVLMKQFKSNIEELFELMTVCPMPIPLSNSFDLFSYQLVQPLKLLKKLFSILIRNDEGRAGTLVQSLTNIGLDPEFVASFYVSQELNINNDTARRIFLDMRKMILTAGI